MGKVKIYAETGVPVEINGQMYTFEKSTVQVSKCLECDLLEVNGVCPGVACNIAEREDGQHVVAKLVNE